MTVPILRLLGSMHPYSAGGVPRNEIDPRGLNKIKFSDLCEVLFALNDSAILGA
jgi:hypothetical protein